MDWATIFTALASVFGLVLAWFFYYSRKPDYWADKNVPYQPKPTLLEGINSFSSKKTYWKIDQEWCQKNGRIFGCHQVLKPMLYVTDPDVIRRILVKDFHLLADRRTFKIDDPIAKCFLTTLTGDDWKRVRSIITPAFSTGRQKKMVSLMDECARMTVDNLIRTAENEGVIDCKRVFGGFTLDVIASTAFGTKLNSAKDPDNIFVQHAKEFFNINFPWRLMFIIFLPRLASFLGIKPFKPVVMSFFVELTNTVARRRRETKEDRGDFLQNLLDAQANGLSDTDQTVDEEITSTDKDMPSEECQSFLKQYSKNKTLSADEFVATCVLFFLAGYDTTATTISMTAYYLALNPERQKKVLEEVDEIWSKHPEPDYEVLSKLKYLDAAISETLRLVPPAPRLERKASCDYPIEEINFTVPKDMIIGVPIYAMHMDPEFFPNPEEYKPERFLPENKDSLKPYTYLPFGAGPRNCLGMRFALMESKLCLLRVFREVTFEICSETKIPPELYKGTGLYQPKTVNLKVIRRNRS